MKIQFLKFCIVGVGNTGLDMLIFYLCVQYMALFPAYANVCAWLVAVQFSYLANALFTFSAGNGRSGLSIQGLLTFMTASVGGMLVATAVLMLAQTVTTVWLAKLISIAVALFFNFFLAKHFVFKRAV